MTHVFILISNFLLIYLILKLIKVHFTYILKDTKKFIKVNKYKSRNNYVDNELNELLIKNTGRLGESFIANTSECLHKAGSVEKGYQRDVIVITFIVTPK